MSYNDSLSIVDLQTNIALDELNIAGTQLRDISLKNNVALKKLNLFGNNISDIDLSNNINISMLDLGENDLSAINLKNNTALKFLWLSENNLDSIDLRSNIELETIDLSSNNIHYLDLSVNKRLSNIYLMSNKLDSLNLTNQNELECLMIGENNISKLDLQNNKNLKELYIRDNNITELALDNKNLDRIDISNNRFNFGTLPLPKLPLITFIPLPNAPLQDIDEFMFYSYYPQKVMIISPLSDIVDLSSQYTVKNKNGKEHLSTYIWKTDKGDVLSKGLDYNEKNGVFTFLKSFSSIYCEIKNEVFPKLILQTNTIDIIMPK